MPTTTTPTSLISREALAKALGVSTRTIDRQDGNPAFPRKIKITARLARFDVGEVNRFLAARGMRAISADFQTVGGAA